MPQASLAIGECLAGQQCPQGEKLFNQNSLKCMLIGI